MAIQQNMTPSGQVRGSAVKYESNFLIINGIFDSRDFPRRKARRSQSALILVLNALPGSI